MEDTCWSTYVRKILLVIGTTTGEELLPGKPRFVGKNHDACIQCYSVSCWFLALAQNFHCSSHVCCEGAV